MSKALTIISDSFVVPRPRLRLRVFVAAGLCGLRITAGLTDLLQIPYYIRVVSASSKKSVVVASENHWGSNALAVRQRIASAFLKVSNCVMITSIRIVTQMLEYCHVSGWEDYLVYQDAYSQD